MIHDNNTLFISIYNQNDAILCPGFCSQISNQTIKSALLNIFIDCPSYYNTYSQYFNLENTETNLFFQHFNSNDITIQDSISNYINRFNYFIIINQSHLLCSDFLEQVKDSQYDDESARKIYSTHDKSHTPVLFFPKKAFASLLRHELSLSSLDFIKIQHEIIIDNFYSMLPPTKPAIQPIVYENQYCLFCEVKENKNISQLSDSYIYINKRNNKVYNINNNVFGEITKKTDTFTEILWIVGETKQKSIYDIVIHE